MIGRARSRRLGIGDSMALVLLVVLAHGCASASHPIGADEITRLKTAPTVHVVQYAPPTFRVATPGSTLAGMYGLIGGLVAEATIRSTGKDFVRDYSLEDPAVRLKDRLTSALAAQLDLKSIRADEAVLEDDAIDTLKRRFGNDMVLDVKTDTWMLGSASGFSTKYHIYYVGRSRVVRLDDRKVVWEGTCKVQGNEHSPGATLAELRANSGELLKVKLAEAADACGQQLVPLLVGQERPNAVVAPAAPR